MPTCEDTLNSIKVSTSTIQEKIQTLENTDNQPLLDAIDFLKDTPLTLIYEKLSLLENVDLSSLTNKVSSMASDIVSFRTTYHEEDIPKLTQDIGNILNSVYSSTPDTYSVLDYLNDNFTKINKNTITLGELKSFLKDNENASNTIFQNTEAIYLSQQKQSTDILSLQTKLNSLRNTDLTSLTQKVNVMASDIVSFRTAYHQNDIPNLTRDIGKILNSVYNSTPDTKSVLDYLNINHALQAQHTIKLEELQKSAENIYEQLNTTFQNTESIHHQNTELNIKVTSMESTIKKMETKINNLQNFNSTSLETKMDKILTFLGQDI